MKASTLRSARLLIPVLAILAMLVAVACGGDDDDETTPTPTDTGTPAASATAGASPSAPASAYPVTVTDLLGRSVEIKAKPITIVAISPTAVEFVYAVGGTVVGRSSSVDFPEAAKAAKDIGTAYQPNFEAILALKPDLVVADSVIHAQPSLRQPIEQLSVPVIFAGADSYQKVLEGLELMGQVLDSKATADKAIADITKARDDAKAAIAGKQISAVALIADRDNTLYAAKDASFAGDILLQLGITNPAASQPDSGPFPGYTVLAPEKMIEFNPDFIFAITPAPEPAPRLASLIPQIPPFKGLKAVTSNHVVDADVQLFLQAPGPRIAEAFKVVADAAKGSSN
jgi:iron complex transport system substrate-binding protein